VPRPVFFVVAEDGPRLEALTRDLQRRYDADYDVVGAAAAATALTMLKDFANTGAGVALLIVDERLTEIPAVDLLERAHDLHPGAKRILLIERGDWSAAHPAVTAMATGQIDYHLYAPWQPAERILYPAISEFLAAWDKSREPASAAFRIVGPAHSPRSHQLRDVLSRTGVPYWFFEDDSEEGRQLLRELALDGARLPVAVHYDGSVLADPSHAELMTKLGVRTSSRRACLQCSHHRRWAGRSRRRRIRGIGRPQHAGPGTGRPRWASWYKFIDPQPPRVPARHQRRRPHQPGDRAGMAVRSQHGDHPGNRADRPGTGPNGRTADGSEVAARAVIIATGVTWRRLGVPALEALVGAGVFYGAAGAEALAMAGRDVFVVGAGNSAGQAAIHLAKYASSVTMVVRGPGLSPSMSEYLITEIFNTANIDVRPGTEVIDGAGRSTLETLTLRDKATRTTHVPAAALFLMIGAEPHTEWLESSVERDDRGFILTGRDLYRAGQSPTGWPLQRPPLLLETSMPGVFAAGDVRHRSMKRVASAVGEGATAIQLVHEYLRGDEG
jgi:thioredoxin reductase (NADPH)